jgi:hypothetical protein
MNIFDCFRYGMPVVESAFVIVRAKTKVVKAPEHALYYQGNRMRP